MPLYRKKFTDKKKKARDKQIWESIELKKEDIGAVARKWGLTERRVRQIVDQYAREGEYNG